METKRLLMLAALLVAACGGSPEPGSEQSSADGLPVAVEDIAPPAADPPATPSAQAAVPSGGAQRPNAPAAASGRFQLGTHYGRLSPTQPTSSSPGQVEVAEIFWYGCPHCYTFDPYLQEWQPGKADYVSFVRIPAVWNPLVRLHARAFYTAEALGKGEEMHEAFFREIHVNGNALDSEAKLAQFFSRFGIDEAAFKNAFDSFAVHTNLQRADELSRRYQVSSVPSVVVNGKYTSDGSMAGGYDALLELIDELTASERTAN